MRNWTMMAPLAVALGLVVSGCGGADQPVKEPDTTKPAGEPVAAVDEPEPVTEPAEDTEQAKLDERLEMAIEAHDWAEVARALAEGAAAQILQDRGGMSELHLAVITGDLEKVDKALASSPDMQETTVGESTALYIAACIGSMEILTAVGAAGASTKPLDENGESALNCAAREGHLEAVKYLVEKKKMSPAKTAEGGLPLFVSAVKSGDLEVVKYLAGKGAKATEADSDGWTALFHAAAMGQVEIAKFLMTKGAKATTKDVDGRTALHVAAGECPASGKSCLEVVELLIKKGAKKDTKDNDGLTPADYAGQSGDEALVSALSAGE